MNTLTVKTFMPDGKKIQHFTARDHADALTRVSVPRGYDGALNVRIEDERGSGCWLFVSASSRAETLAQVGGIADAAGKV